MIAKKLLTRSSPETDEAIFPTATHRVLKRIYAARNIRSSGDLDTGLQALLTPESLSGLGTAVDVLVSALAEGKKLLVVGDFDADGATSSALMVMALRAMGATRVDYLVPNRFEFGYGLTPGIVELAAATFKPNLIITVDNGISSLEGVAAARRHHIDVLVTDHHLPGPELPAACAIVNPNQPNDNFPSKALAGVGVAFYLLLALRARLDASGWFAKAAIRKPNLADYLDLVALGTVADLVPLDKNNRILVQQGLQRIRAGNCRPGIQALLEIAGRNPRRVVASDFGFAVGPRLNAAGRLDDMSLGIECLMSQSQEQAHKLAAQLDGLNRERREIETDMKSQAMAAVEQLDLTEAGLPMGLCLFNQDWHQGVIGILASRVKERFHRPVIAFAPAGSGEIKGSARSIPGLHIRDTLDAIAACHPGLLQKFGGHAMAAGMSLEVEKLPAFEKAFHNELEQRLDQAALMGVIESDGELNDDEFSLELSEQLRQAGPWGQGFAEPLFDGRFKVVNVRTVGENHLKLSVRPSTAKCTLNAIAFNQAAEHPIKNGQSVRMAYRLDTNEYRGMLGLQLVINHIEPM
ncbi:Single-stranded-DNA-specific exonuclease RecJ [hydrothermal vent metagenome]|uniref:Single-stranded-DNA-specific exonuclease RecJ n=1 Tax=hydrothermal vent metagenome TaxID=652676 RepID=A0A3B0YLB2_9ZZZZ